MRPSLARPQKVANARRRAQCSCSLIENSNLAIAHNCYNRFVRWRKGRLWDRNLEAVSKAYDRDIQI